jgi:hypothetical protein
MDNHIKTTEFIPPARLPWHAPALKMLKVSNTLANTIPGPTYDGTFSTLDGS